MSSMEDDDRKGNEVPYNDPYDTPYNYEHVLNIVNDQNPTLADLGNPTQQQQGPYGYPPQMNPNVNVNVNVNDPYVVPTFNWSNLGDPQAGQSRWPNPSVGGGANPQVDQSQQIHGHGESQTMNWSSVEGGGGEEHPQMGQAQLVHGEGIPIYNWPNVGGGGRVEVYPQVGPSQVQGQSITIYNWPNVGGGGSGGGVNLQVGRPSQQVQGENIPMLDWTNVGVGGANAQVSSQQRVQDENVPMLDWTNVGVGGVHAPSGPSQVHGENNPMFNWSNVGGEGRGGSGGNAQAGPSQVRGESSNTVQRNARLRGFHMIPLSIWPEPPSPFLCSCCQTLREIVHTNGAVINRLEIHGRLGIIIHAILEERTISGESSTSQFVMFDFIRKNIEEVKYFLMQYCLDQTLGGHILVPDPLSAYYEALCTGLDWDEDLNDNDLSQLRPNVGGGDQGGNQMDQDDQDGGNPGDRNPRVSLSSQRERAGKMTLRDFSGLFHLPIEEAARQVHLCPTVVKRICRKEGLGRWPHRKVKSILKRVTILRQSYHAIDNDARVRVDAEIERLRIELTQHCGGVFPTAINFD